MECVKVMNQKKKIHPRLTKKITSGAETFYLSFTLTKAVLVDESKAFN